MSARKKRQADPYAEESTEVDEEEASLEIASKANSKSTEKKGPPVLNGETKLCCHANRSVNTSQVKRTLKVGITIGECTQCQRARTPLGFLNENSNETKDNYVPVIWFCVYCGNQGCDRNSSHKHAFHHYKTPRSDSHCVVINTQAWTIWCYECDSEVIHTSAKKLDEVLQLVKKASEMAPRRSVTSLRLSSRPYTNLTSQYGGSDSRLHLSMHNEENLRNLKNNRLSSALDSIPRVKGLRNLGNTCFFNSVMQGLGQTHFLMQLLDLRMQSGQRIMLPGQLPSTEEKKVSDKRNADHRSRCVNGESVLNEIANNENDLELKPMELFLAEGGALSLSLSMFIKDMHAVGKNGVVNPGHLFGIICKKSPQFQGNQEQDSHELLRCLLDAIRNEEIVRTKKSILKAFALSEKTNPNSVNTKLKNLIKGYGKQATHTIVDEIFGGQLISTVFCEACQWSSQVFEPFMDMSLPINEGKGKPKKCTSTEDDGLVDSIGRSSNTVVNGHVTSDQLSRHQKKKLKSMKRKRKNSVSFAKGSSKGKGGKSIPEMKEFEERRRRRLTEKRRPEDAEEFRQKEEAEKRFKEAKKEAINLSKSESSKFKKLLKDKSMERRPSDEGSDEEELEYDNDEEEDDEDSFGVKKAGKGLPVLIPKSTHTKQPEAKANENEGEEEEEDEADEEEEEEEVEEEEEEEEEESEEEASEDSDISSSKNSKNQSEETSDADVEDNTDSEHGKHGNTRHPSIVVDTSDRLNGLAPDTNFSSNRLVRSCLSCDQLNYNSASDTSERYFTAAAGDTMDELDSALGGDSASIRYDHAPSITTTSGKGDSLSISSADTLAGTCEDRHDRKLLGDTSHIEEMCLQVGELKLRRKSKESLLDSHSKCHKKGFAEPTHERTEDIEHRKTQTMKKLKQQWIARSLTTLAPRYQCGRQECSIMSCLTSFTSPELLTGNNKIACENCTRIKAEKGEETNGSVKSNASKQMLIFSPPAVLTLHLKRFQHVGYKLAKVNKYVQFPLVLDIAPFTSSISLGLENMQRGQMQVLYGLYGIVEHSGRLNSGHYVAYVRARPVDLTRTVKQILNLKPSNHFQVDHLISEMMQRAEFSAGHKNLKSDNFKPANIQELIEEVKSGRWFHVSDSSVSEVNIDKVMKAQGYLLFYERIL